MNQTEGKTPYLDIRVATSTTTTTRATRTTTTTVATTSKSKWQMVVGYVKCINYVSYNCSHFRPSQMQTRKSTTKERNK